MPFTHILRDIDYCSSDIGKTNVLYTYRMSGNLIWFFNFLYYSNFLKYTSSRWYHNMFSDSSIYTSNILFKRDVELVNSLLIQRFCVQIIIHCTYVFWSCRWHYLPATKSTLLCMYMYFDLNIFYCIYINNTSTLISKWININLTLAYTIHSFHL